MATKKKCHVVSLESGTILALLLVQKQRKVYEKRLVC